MGLFGVGASGHILPNACASPREGASGVIQRMELFSSGREGSCSSPCSPPWTLKILLDGRLGTPLAEANMKAVWMAAKELEGKNVLLPLSGCLLAQLWMQTPLSFSARAQCMAYGHTLVSFPNSVLSHWLWVVGTGEYCWRTTVLHASPNGNKREERISKTLRHGRLTEFLWGRMLCICQ